MQWAAVNTYLKDINVPEQRSTIAPPLKLSYRMTAINLYSLISVSFPLEILFLRVSPHMSKGSNSEQHTTCKLIFYKKTVRYM